MFENADRTETTDTVGNFRKLIRLIIGDEANFFYATRPLWLNYVRM